MKREQGTGAIPTGAALLACVLLAVGLAFAASSCSLTDKHASSTTATSSHKPVSTSTTGSSTTAKSTAATTTSSRSSTTAKPTTTTQALSPGKEYERIPTNEKVVALTFDAAYDPSPLPAILAALEKGGAKGTFFLTGEFLRDFPKSVAQIVAAGFPIGNHSYSHPDFTKLTDVQMRSQLSRTASAIVKAGAEDPRPLFRPPYGARNKHVLAVLRSAGYVSVYWTIDTLDWETTRTPAQIEHAVMSKLKPGAIILMHVGSKQTASILPTLLEEIKAQGYSFVTLREALPSSVN
jgi:peptidoglycan/xylan/chitin deacetylase (PgdA/CDA1 family)